MSWTYPESRVTEEEERQEVKAILESGILKKAPNLQHFLEYVAAEYFAGNSDGIKEYNIAVQALHRSERFDPQSDTIVRVSAHALRKKLEQYYAAEGSSHPVQMQLPAGKYVPTFERKQPEQSASPELQAMESPLSTFPFFESLSEEHEPIPALDGVRERSRFRLAWVGVGAGMILFAAVAVFLHMRGRNADLAGRENAIPVAAGLDNVLRMRFGSAGHPYLDAAGQEWLAEQYCTGGTAFTHTDQEIQGTADPTIFREGRGGTFQCKIPAPPGEYQLKLLFADTAGDKEAARQVDFSINDRRAEAIDVVDEAGGADIAIGKVYAGIHPMSDGTIHLNFLSDGAFVNAVELTPSRSKGGAPLRMLAGPAVVRDSSGNVWGPEFFFEGGRRTFHPDNLPKVADPKIFEWERYGHFRYLIPVVPGEEYRLRLYFSEGWFGSTNGGPGGIGSRQFDVYCNGETLLSNFDILREEKDGVTVMTFDGIKPTAHGMLELQFAPVENYPLINAIEVEPER